MAMHFINARANTTTPQAQADAALEQRYEEILEQTTQIIKWEMNMRVRRDTFNYARFATHLKYLLKRLMEKKHIDSSNPLLYETTREEYQDVAACVDKISEYYAKGLSATLNKEEQLYLLAAHQPGVQPRGGVTKTKNQITDKDCCPIKWGLDLQRRQYMPYCLRWRFFAYFRRRARRYKINQ